MKDQKFVYFRELQQFDGRKTKVFNVVNVHHEEAIGEIRWGATWRQYIFKPYEGTQWSAGCLDQITEFIRYQMGERKKDAQSKLWSKKKAEGKKE